MCYGCGCQEYLQQGKEAILKRAVEIVKELSLTAQNIDDYEATEMIADLIVPFGSREDEVFQTAAWMASLHITSPRSGQNQRYEAYTRAFRDIFARLPAQGNSKYIVTTYHQLEQLAREIDEAALSSLDAATREALQALNRVHDNLRAKVARLKERYGL